VNKSYLSKEGKMASKKNNMNLDPNNKSSKSQKNTQRGVGQERDFNTQDVNSDATGTSGKAIDSDLNLGNSNVQDATDAEQDGNKQADER
jgi:hypothetical protein